MKQIKRLMPVNIYDISQVESYFSSMAAQGYFIKKIGTFAWFEKGQPQPTRYRLEPLMKKERQPSETMLAYYEEQGWEYVFTIAKLFHVYKTARQDAIELHTDPVTQGHAFEYLQNRLHISFWSAVTQLPLCVCISFYILLFHDHPVLYAVRYGQTTYLCLWVFILLFMGIESVANYRKIQRLTVQLCSGITMTHKKGYKTNYRPYFISAAALLVGGIMLFSSVYQIAAGWEADLKDYAGSLPGVRLSDIETHPDFEIERHDYKGRDFHNHIEYSWSDLAPRTYEVQEQGVVKGQTWRDSSGEYSPSLQTRFYQVRFGFLAKPLLSDLVDDAIAFSRFEHIGYQELLETDFDQAFFLQVNAKQMLLARLGKKVVYVRYYGYEDLRQFTGALYQAVADF